MVGGFFAVCWMLSFFVWGLFGGFCFLSFGFVCAACFCIGVCVVFFCVAGVVGVCVVVV